MGSNLLLNHAEYLFTDGRRVEFAPFNFRRQVLEMQRWDSDLQDNVITQEIELHAELRGIPCLCKRSIFTVN